MTIHFPSRRLSIARVSALQGLSRLDGFDVPEKDTEKWNEAVRSTAISWQQVTIAIREILTGFSK
jgi:hypothetical protein